MDLNYDDKRKTYFLDAEKVKSTPDHEALDLYSHGATLYQLIDNAKYYFSDRDAKVYNEADDKFAEEFIKSIWREHHEGKEPSVPECPLTYAKNKMIDEESA